MGTSKRPSKYMRRKGFIYCADTPEGYIKIGFTSRSLVLKAWYLERGVDTNWPDLKKSHSRMLAFFPATQKEEFAMHKRFQYCHVRPPAWLELVLHKQPYKREWYRHYSSAGLWFFSQPYEFYTGTQYFPKETEASFAPISQILEAYRVFLAKSA